MENQLSLRPLKKTQSKRDFLKLKPLIFKSLKNYKSKLPKVLLLLKFKKRFLLVSIPIILLVTGIGVYLNFTKVKTLLNYTGAVDDNSYTYKVTENFSTWHQFRNYQDYYWFDYPGTLVNYLIVSGDKVFINRPDQKEIPVFSIDAYSFVGSPDDFWNQQGVKQYSWFTKSFSEQVDQVNSQVQEQEQKLSGVKLTGQRKMADGHLVQYQLLLIPHNNYIYVVQDNTQVIVGNNQKIDSYIIKTLRFDR